MYVCVYVGVDVDVDVCVGMKHCIHHKKSFAVGTNSDELVLKGQGHPPLDDKALHRQSGG